MNILDTVRRKLSANTYVMSCYLTQGDLYNEMKTHLTELKDYCKELKWDVESWDKEYTKMEEKYKGEVYDLKEKLSDYEATDELNVELRKDVEDLKEELEELEGEVIEQDDLIPNFRHVQDKMRFEEMVRQWKLENNYHD